MSLTLIHLVNEVLVPDRILLDHVLVGILSGRVPRVVRALVDSGIVILLALPSTLHLLPAPRRPHPLPTIPTAESRPHVLLQHSHRLLLGVLRVLRGRRNDDFVGAETELEGGVGAVGLAVLQGDVPVLGGGARVLVAGRGVEQRFEIVLVAVVLLVGDVVEQLLFRSCVLLL